MTSHVNSPIHLRPYDPSDADALWALFRRTIHHVNAADYDVGQLEAWAPDVPTTDRWRQSFVGKFCRVAAEPDGTVVGFADLRADGYLDRFFVHHERQRRGIGRRLLDALEAEARREGHRRIFLEASLTARPFFESHGYRVERAQTVELRGARLDNFAMAKSLVS